MSNTKRIKALEIEVKELRSIIEKMQQEEEQEKKYFNEE